MGEFRKDGVEREILPNMNLYAFRPSYAINRIAQMRYQSANPSVPWLTADAVTALQDLLKPTDVGFEFGSGRSTVWFARHIKFLHSMESSADWYQKVTQWLAREGLAERVNYQLALEPREDDLMPDDHPYVQGIAAMQEDSLDFAFIDGIMRLTSLRWAMKKLKPGGILILDNANTYLSNRYEEGYTTVHCRSDKPRDSEWSKTWEELSKWRGFNTTDRINDTRFWFVPIHKSSAENIRHS